MLIFQGVVLQVFRIFYLSGACDASTGGDHKGSAHPYGAGDDFRFSSSLGSRKTTGECMYTPMIQPLENSRRRIHVDGKGR